MLMQISAGTLLQNINSPEDLKKIPKEHLHQVCNELRQFIVCLLYTSDAADDSSV